MPQPKKKAAKKAAPKKTAKKAAPKRPAAVTPQVSRSRMTTQTKNDSPPAEEPREETQADLDAAGDARRDQVRTPGRKGKAPDQVYEPEHQELEAADLDQDSAEEERQAELAEQRDEHNRRTGDASRGIAAEVGSN